MLETAICTSCLSFAGRQAARRRGPAAGFKFVERERGVRARTCGMPGAAHGRCGRPGMLCERSTASAQAGASRLQLWAIAMRARRDSGARWNISCRCRTDAPSAANGGRPRLRLPYTPADHAGAASGRASLHGGGRRRRLRGVRARQMGEIEGRAPSRDATRRWRTVAELDGTGRGSGRGPTAALRPSKF